MDKNKDSKVETSKEDAEILSLERRIFGDSEISEMTAQQIADELGQGLSQADHDFIENVVPQLKERLTPMRYAHSISVARECKRIAGIYGVDLSLAVRTGLLHDWDKCYKGQDVFNRVLELGLALPEDYQNMRPIFHAITGARALELKFPELESEIIQAVGRHTGGATDMQPLDMIVFIADMIEPTRMFERLNPLRDMVGTMSLECLFAQCYKATLIHLISTDKYLMVGSDQIWNSCLPALGKSSGRTSTGS